MKQAETKKQTKFGKYDQKPSDLEKTVGEGLFALLSIINAGSNEKARETQEEVIRDYLGKFS